MKKPDTTEDLNEMVKFIEETKTVGIVNLEKQIKDLRAQMAYLLDIHLFGKEDIDLNTKVALWPTEIGPIFDQNEEVFILFYFIL